MAIAMVMISCASALDVKFNGNWNSGSILYSNNYHVINSTIYGKDVYPIKDNCVNATVCSRYNYTNVRTCISNYGDICEKYGYHYERRCQKYNGLGNCTIYKNIRIQDNCTSYRNDICRTYKTSRVKVNCILNRTQTLCSINSSVECLDPISGIFTNQLSLNNFKMNINNGSWVNIPYLSNQIHINNSNIIFKVDIPVNCNPVFDINKSIYIVS